MKKTFVGRALSAGAAVCQDRAAAADSSPSYCCAPYEVRGAGMAGSARKGSGQSLGVCACARVLGRSACRRTVLKVRLRPATQSLLKE